MDTPKIALNLARLSVQNLIELIRAVVAAMTDNAHFEAPNPLPDPPLADLTTAANALESAQANKKVLGIINRNNKRKAAAAKLKSEAIYVTVRANGDGAIMQSAGMPLAKERTPLNHPGEVKSVKIKDGTASGQVYLTHKGASGKLNQYFCEYSLDPSLADKSWVDLDPTGKLKILIKDLPSGRRVAFRVRARNTAGFGVYSTVAFRIIQ